ncbi:hypothetical protein NM208_g2791 [Fusarium decemcellulare]|uniref:Uncharacterized protein n=1 Tax=Fusarium decemcellulare TaxID=57161 RepID=A0ACC1SR69_9HYPO|nr:hypothetical protein NM208_g2791 [Fusarium decemcellulare]
MRLTAQRAVLRWHGLLCLPKHPQSWYRARLREEFSERRLAVTACQKLSDTADVLYIISRAKYDGHVLKDLPRFSLSHLAVYAYLLSKYTSRWQFYRVAVLLSGCRDLDSMREVINPTKDHKIREVACRHGIDPRKIHASLPPTSVDMATSSMKRNQELSRGKASSYRRPHRRFLRLIGRPQLNDQDKSVFRGQAIDAIRDESAHTGRVAVVTGHLMFWSDNDGAGQPVYTSNDLETFTHIIYLDIPAETISQRRTDDSRETSIDRVSALIQYFRQSTVESNLAHVRTKVDEILALNLSDLETFLVMDGDKTLAPDDTGTLFWDALAEMSQHPKTWPLEKLFGGPLGYSDTAFYQATLLYEDTANDKQFDKLCDTAASSVTLYPDIVSMLHLAAEHRHVGVVVVTCGLGRVWEKVLERISDGFIVTPAVKADIVSRLQNWAYLYVWAFGDSPLDLPMLKQVDRAIVVAIEDEDLQVRQVLLPNETPLRLDKDRLPVTRLDEQLVASIMQRRFIEITHATEKPAARLLSTPTRDTSVAGPALRKAHQDVGWYLATEYVSQLIGLEQFSIPHVKDYQTTGYRLHDERQTSIIALMRGGEAMAFGISAAFQAAMFVHASSALDVKRHHIDGQATVILVDSVVNSGKTLMEFINRIRVLDAYISIVVVAGLVQAEAVADTHALHRLMRRHGASMIALRLSENKFTGTKTTDTGNRLFNTTHLA